MLVISTSLVLSDADAALPSGTPMILWDNRVTISNVTASSADASYPATNLANPATNQEWRAADALATSVVLEVTVNSGDDIDGVGIARHNFGSEGVSVAIEADDSAVDTYEKVLLHFNGADGSTTITDSNTGGSAHTWTASGDAQIDSTSAAFGGASGLFDGTGDYVSTPDHADFTLGASDFTIDCWFNCTATTGSYQGLAGQNDAGGVAANAAWRILRNVDDTLLFNAVIGAAFAVGLQSTSTFNDVVNDGWHHLAVTRSGNTWRLFIDGVIEDSDTVSGTVDNSTEPLTVGQLGSQAITWTGWIDEFRLSVGIARWTANFTSPTTAYNSAVLAGPQIPPTDEPMLFQFTPQPISKLRVVLTYDSGVIPRAAVLYVGPLMATERGYDVGTEFTPPLFARKTQAVNGMSHAGDFLGRIITSQAIDGSVATWKHFTPDWYRDEFDPFVAAAQRDTPFFFAWLPEEYPYEVAFAWLAEDPYPVVSPITRRMHVSIKMDGIVE